MNNVLLLNQRADNRYASAVGMVRALETRLLNRQQINRLIEMDDLDDIWKFLMETDYGQSMADVEDDNFEELFNKELFRIYKLIKAVDPDSALIDLFAQRYDFHNLKALLKAKCLQEDASYALFDFGLIGVELLKEMVNKNNFEMWDVSIRDKIKEFSEKLEEEESECGEIDFYIDKLMYSFFYLKAVKKKNPFLKELWQKQIDLINIKTFFRVKRLDRKKEFLEEVLLDNGKLPKGLFLSLYGAALEDFVDKVRFTPYASIVKEGFEAYKVNKSLSLFEKLSDNFIMDFLKNTKYIIFGVEPLIAYLLAKENEIKNLQVIVVSKVNNISQEIIKGRLREVYA